VKRICIAVLATALLASAVAPSAQADRAATRREHLAISWVMGRPVRCDAVRISTAARGWALLYSRGLRSCGRWNANGYVVLERRYGQWRNRYANSGTQNLPCSRIRPVPAEVGRDFGICAR
jgi:hypothetical protein